MFEPLVIEDVVPGYIQQKLFNKMLEYGKWTFLQDVSGNINQPYPSMGFVDTIKRPVEGVLRPQIYNEISVLLANAIIQRGVLTGNLDLVHCRTFLQLPLRKEFKKKYNGIHIDLPDPHLAAVYYFCDSDGDTVIFKNNDHNTERGSNHNKLEELQRVTPKRGRAVVFDGAYYHASSQPQKNMRLIMNFNFTEKTNG